MARALKGEHAATFTRETRLLGREARQRYFAEVSRHQLEGTVSLWLQMKGRRADSRHLDASRRTIHVVERAYSSRQVQTASHHRHLGRQ